MQSRSAITTYLHKPWGIFFQKDSSTLNDVQTIQYAQLKNADSLCFLRFQDLSFGLFCVLTATKDSHDLHRSGRITVSFNHPKLKTSSCLDSALCLARGSVMSSSSFSSSSSSSSSSCLGEWLDLFVKLTGQSRWGPQCYCICTRIYVYIWFRDVNRNLKFKVSKC